jgi:hypothetical protein
MKTGTFFIAAVVTSGLIIPALAHKGMMEFFVVQDMATKKCAVTKEKPKEKDSSKLLVSPAEVEYKSVDEANKAMMSFAACQ